MRRVTGCAADSDPVSKPAAVSSARSGRSGRVALRTPRETGCEPAPKEAPLLRASSRGAHPFCRMLQLPSRANVTYDRRNGQGREPFPRKGLPQLEEPVQHDETSGPPSAGCPEGDPGSARSVASEGAPPGGERNVDRDVPSGRDRRRRTGPTWWNTFALRPCGAGPRPRASRQGLRRLRLQRPGNTAEVSRCRPSAMRPLSAKPAPWSRFLGAGTARTTESRGKNRTNPCDGPTRCA